MISASLWPLLSLFPSASFCPLPLGLFFSASFGPVPPRLRSYDVDLILASSKPHLGQRQRNCPICQISFASDLNEADKRLRGRSLNEAEIMCHKLLTSCFSGQQSVYSDLHCQGLASNGKPYVTAADGFSVEDASRVSAHK